MLSIASLTFATCYIIQNYTNHPFLLHHPFSLLPFWNCGSIKPHHQSNRSSFNTYMTFNMKNYLCHKTTIVLEQVQQTFVEYLFIFWFSIQHFFLSYFDFWPKKNSFWTFQQWFMVLCSQIFYKLKLVVIDNTNSRATLMTTIFFKWNTRWPIWVWIGICLHEK